MALLPAHLARAPRGAHGLRFALSLLVLAAACGDEEEGATPQGNTGDAGSATDAGGQGPAPSFDGNLAPALDAGVSSFDAGSTAERNTVAPGAVCERFATLQCAAEQACCSSPGRAMDACMTVQLATCRVQGHIDEASMIAASGFDSARAKTAFEAFEVLARSCDPRVTPWVLDVSGFRGVFVGTLNAGEGCTPPLFSLSEASAAGAALSCKDPATTACLPDAGAWLCVARGGTGARCFTDANCAGETYCNNAMPGLATLGADTQCVARKAVGAACVGGGECSSLACVGQKCVPVSVDAAFCLGR